MSYPLWEDGRVMKNATSHATRRATYRRLQARKVRGSYFASWRQRQLAQARLNTLGGMLTEARERNDAALDTIRQELNQGGDHDKSHN